LRSVGIKAGDRVTICLPNCPQGVVMFYALNCIGALPNMIHPLSAEGEIEFYLNFSHSVAAITLNAFYPKFANIRGNCPDLQILLIAGIAEELNPIMKIGFQLTKGRKIKPIPADADVIYWPDFIKMGKNYRLPYRVHSKPEDPAAILYSGGTTGTTKGIALSNLNFNALSLQTITAADCYTTGDSMLAIMPMFHGFGLGICINMMLQYGGRCILVPQFTPQSYAELLKKQKPNFIAGVPTLYEALLRNEHLNGVSLDCLKGMFSGGDSLSVELKKKVDAFLKAHNSNIQVREGYGTTECVTASCLTPRDFAKEGSIGIPFSDTYYKVVTPGGHDELPYGEIGEICISGPTVMLGYIDNPKETAHTLQQHEDGMLWLHTGDLGSMDEDGFVYYKQRLKRMIVSSGYNIYPAQLENILDAHELVQMSCVIGVPDPYKMQKVKAFVKLAAGVEPGEETKAVLLDHCRKHVAKYAMPYDIEFKEDMPKTLVGKVAYRVLEEEELAKMK
ncbi:MAG: acyl--CoA ligase, partial [Clostridia bacterium]|nr:acyl--CoA ligase [Clostridia bacterium]